MKVGDVIVCTCPGLDKVCKIPRKIKRIEDYGYIMANTGTTSDRILKKYAKLVTHYNTKLGKVLYK